MQRCTYIPSPCTPGVCPSAVCLCVTKTCGQECSHTHSSESPSTRKSNKGSLQWHVPQRGPVQQDGWAGHRSRTGCVTVTHATSSEGVGARESVCVNGPTDVRLKAGSTGQRAGVRAVTTHTGQGWLWRQEGSPTGRLWLVTSCWDAGDGCAHFAKTPEAVPL